MEMVKIKNIELLSEVIKQHCPQYENIIDNDAIKIQNNQIIDDLCNAISAELCDTGLDKNDEPNSRGLMLEDLLDTINRPRIKPE